MAEIHWYEATGVGRVEFKVKLKKASTRAIRRVAVCVKNDGYPASLEVRKLYQLLPDPTAARHGQVRVIDESGEDHLYPSSYFVALDLPLAVRKALHAA